MAQHAHAPQPTVSRRKAVMLVAAATMAAVTAISPALAGQKKRPLTTGEHQVIAATDDLIRKLDADTARLNADTARLNKIGAEADARGKIADAQTAQAEINSRCMDTLLEAQGRKFQFQGVFDRKHPCDYARSNGLLPAQSLN